MASKKNTNSYHSTERTRRGATTTFGSRTDIGCVREQNEDSLVVAPPLFVVADGMGGHAAGEVASEIAVNVIAQNAPDHPDPDALASAVEEANRSIIDAAMSGKGREGMGTTCTAAMLEGERLVVAQVGDSRAYLLHNGQLTQLTRDHSLMAALIEAGEITPEEARVHPRRSVITRALGNDPATRPDIYEVNVEAGDRLMLCSDGLSGMILDEDIAAVMRRVRDPQRCASQLVNEAIAAGGHDNVTVIVADVEGTREKQRKKVVRRTKVWLAFIILLFAAILGGAAWGTNQYLSHVAYLADSDGNVAVYRGVPGDFFGISSSSLIEVTDVAVKDLPSTARGNVESGLRCDSIESAYDLVEDYRSDIEEREQQKAKALSASSASSSSSSNSASGAGAASSDSAAASGAAVEAAASNGGVTGAASTQNAASAQNAAATRGGGAA